MIVKMEVFGGWMWVLEQGVCEVAGWEWMVGFGGFCGGWLGMDGWLCVGGLCGGWVGEDGCLFWWLGGWLMRWVTGFLVAGWVCGWMWVSDCQDRSLW